MNKAMLTILGALVFAGASAPVSAAAEGLPTSLVSPADGTIVETGTTLPPFETRTDLDVYGGTLYVEISTQNVLAQDGTLANDYRVGSLELFESDASPGTYRNLPSATPPQWLATPGTYYWMAFGLKDGILYRTPVFTLEVRAPAEPAADSLSRREALAVIPRIIGAETGRRPYRLGRRCSRLDEVTFECRIAWQTTRKLRRRTRVYAGDLTIQAQDASLAYAFDGTTATWGCLKRRSLGWCGRPVRWSDRSRYPPQAY